MHLMPFGRCRPFWALPDSPLVDVCITRERGNGAASIEDSR
jgi:hypothetical protein